MKLAELPDDFTPEQFKQLDKEALDSLPYTVIKWNCQVKGCCNGTTVRDYGIHPWYFLNRNSKNANKNPTDYWKGIQNQKFSNWLLCGKHNMFFKRLEKSFDLDSIIYKLCDWDKIKIDTTKIIRSVNQGVEKIEIYGKR